jgi:hypothetical protein
LQRGFYGFSAGVLRTTKLYWVICKSDINTIGLRSGIGGKLARLFSPKSETEKLEQGELQ